MKKRFLLLLLLLFALFGVLVVVPRLIDGTLLPNEMTTESPIRTAEPPTETTIPPTIPPETEESEPAVETTDQPIGPGGPGGMLPPPETEYDPGEPVDRTKVVTDIIFASDIHYMSPSLTDYGNAFKELVDNGDGKVVRYMPQIWQAFAEEVIAARPDALILSGDLTINGEKINHQELASHLADIESAGIPVLVIPGNHDINNPYATQYYGDSQSFIDTVTPAEFREIYGAFGYNEAVSHAPDSLSYLCILNETTWMLMLDSCIYDPDNEVDGELKEGTMDWIEQCLKDAYAQGITVIPVAHHNLQELSRVYVDECVIRNHEELTKLLEKYLTPAFFSGHLHVQYIHKHMKGPGMPATHYGITEVVSNSLLIPPCQYGALTLHEDGTMSYHTRNTDISGWAAKHGETNMELLDFPIFSNQYIRSVIRSQIHKEITYLPEDIKAAMVEFYADLYGDYYAGKTIVYDERISEYGYQMWERFRSETVQFRQIEGMLKDSMANNNNAEIPNPVDQTWER